MPSLFRKKRESVARADRVKLETGDGDVGVICAVLQPRLLIGILLGIAFLILLEFLFPLTLAGSGMELQVGQVAREEIVAPFDFDVLKSEDVLRQERSNAEASVVPVFTYHAGLQTAERKRFGDFLTRIYGIRAGTEPERQRLDMLGQLGVALADSTREILLDRESADAVEERAREILYVLYERGILRDTGVGDLDPDNTIVVVRQDAETIDRVGIFNRLSDVDAIIAREAAKTFTEPAMRRAVRELVAPFVRANVVYDAGETERRRKVARDGVDEYMDIDFKEDEIIVERGERITRDHLNVIRSMEIKQASLLNMEAGYKRFFPILGRFLQAAMLLAVFALYICVRRPGMINRLRFHVLYLVLVSLVMMGAAVVARVPGATPYLVPITILSMLTSMLFGFELAIVSTFVAVMLVATYTSFGLPFAFVSFVAGAIAAHSVRRVRHREDFYWSGIRVVAAYAVTILVADISRVEFGLSTLSLAAWGGVNALVSMGIVIVALPLFERGFKVTTDITLLELADMNKPLLRKMAMVSPGTYHHSIVVGNLAEAAAEAIRANGVLARVGAYYHDIGKLLKPGYFIENQQGLDPSDSKHTGIKPKVSSLIIAAHVKDGVELAKKEGLPAPIIDIVREHHGTSRIEYFYNKAIEESKNPDEVESGDYSYPGPRPRSKVSAIIMLADALEARVRSLTGQLNPKRLEAEIDEVIEKRWSGHQLDDAELTLRDLRRIREAFFRVLVGMYHQRIKYPDQEQEDSSSRPDDGEPAD